MKQARIVKQANASRDNGVIYRFSTDKEFQACQQQAEALIEYLASNEYDDVTERLKRPDIPPSVILHALNLSPPKLIGGQLMKYAKEVLNLQPVREHAEIGAPLWVFASPARDIPDTAVKGGGSMEGKVSSPSQQDRTTP